MFLALGGLAMAAQANEQSRAMNSWQYYNAGAGTIRVSDDDQAVSPAAARQQSGHEQNALYLAEGSGRRPDGLLTSYFDSAACGCGAAACSQCCDSCCDPTINGVRFEWLGWFSRGRNTPPLVSTGPLNAGGVVLFGNDPMGTNLRNGGRITLSHLFADGITSGDVRFWGIEDGSAGFFTNTAATPVFGYPFNNANLGGAPDFLPLSGGGLVGQVNVLAKNDIIGADAWLRRSLFDDAYGGLEVLAGYQFSRLDDSIRIDSATALVLGNPTFISDSFRTQNEFHGASVGVLAKSYRGMFTIETLAKLAFGNMRQFVAVGGLTNPGGWFAQPTNIGAYERNRAAFIPELNVNLIYDVSPQWRLITGYSFIYWSSVVLAGNQIDSTINPPIQLPGATRPAFPFQRTDFWVQGVNLGAEFRW
jgi:hypothetical protein